ncbi:Pre-rRNA-processing protein TSR2 [Madurella mycetomatis]|uniref:Pre-rRNA-processing protein TSR2 n=1 Tax=Madurella mycetomatis TaxID=100816 RepID=A0A175W080_9PEZI|nr:Pre-rRNA-processing protein TSR2 [Madurella mycetomatis]
MTSSAPSPSPGTCQSHFEQGVAIALHLWPALTLAVQNNWGGPDSSDKRDWFAGAIVDLFPDISKLSPAQLQQKLRQQSQQSQSQSQPQGSDQEPDQVDVETVLLQVMLDEFEVNVEDESAYEVAEQVVRIRGECLRGRFDEVEALRRRWEGRRGNKVVFKKGEEQEDETDWDTDEDGDEQEDGDVDMDEAPALIEAQASKEKKAPEVDEDGFTMVTRKKR